mmetsp:Transcript_30978/g.48288  ORF Transcript_30978/g.48288 Transcript_30978/m.48288 type:complete len:245 (+) Transcript_30978:61-795(+)
MAKSFSLEEGALFSEDEFGCSDMKRQLSEPASPKRQSSKSAECKRKGQLPATYAEPELCEPEWEPDINDIISFPTRQVTEEVWSTYPSFPEQQPDQLQASNAGHQLVQSQAPPGCFFTNDTSALNMWEPRQAELGLPAILPTPYFAEAFPAAFRHYGFGVDPSQYEVGNNRQPEIKRKRKKQFKKESLIDMAKDRDGQNERASPPKHDTQKPFVPKFCAACGGDLQPAFKFCMFCGASISLSEI